MYTVVMEHEGILQFNKIDPSLFSQPKSLRDQLIDNVYDRMENKWSKTRIAIRLATACPEDMDIHYLWKKCSEADNYCKCFFGLTKVK